MLKSLVFLFEEFFNACMPPQLKYIHFHSNDRKFCDAVALIKSNQEAVTFAIVVANVVAIIKIVCGDQFSFETEFIFETFIKSHHF